MEQRPLGSGGLTVSRMGLGCMGMSEFYGPGDEKESIRTIHRALDLGMNFLDTADIYGLGRNEELVGKAIRDRRNKAGLATKFGNVRGADGSWLGVNGGRREGIDPNDPPCPGPGDELPRYGRYLRAGTQ